MRRGHGVRMVPATQAEQHRPRVTQAASSSQQVLQHGAAYASSSSSHRGSTTQRSATVPHQPGPRFRPPRAPAGRAWRQSACRRRRQTFQLKGSVQMCFDRAFTPILEVEGAQRGGRLLVGDSACCPADQRHEGKAQESAAATRARAPQQQPPHLSRWCTSIMKSWKCVRSSCRGGEGRMV